MLYTLEQVMANRLPLITVRHDTSMLDALRLLIERRFGQVPVVDEAGQLVGLVSQQAILGVYLLTDGQAPLFDLTVVECMDPATTISLHDDLLSAVELLRNRGVYAAVIMEETRPIGILTGKDMAVLFQSLFEGILLVERIERSLRALFQVAFPDERAYTNALINSFGADKRDPTKPQRGGRELSLTDMVYMVRDDDVWPFFAPLFGNRDYFRILMDSVRVLRNDMAHFSGHTDLLEMNALRRAAIWLENRLQQAAPPATAQGEQPQEATRRQTMAHVLGERRPVICTTPDTLLREALGKMVENRFGQLPVVDEHGHLLGMLSQQSIVRTYYHTEGVVNLLDLPVSHCTEAATTLHLDDDLFTAANILAQSGQYASVVVEEDKPVGLLTGKDMTRFLRSLFEGVILVERVETRLHDYIAQAFPDAAALNEAAKLVFGPGPNQPQYAARNPARFTFADVVSFMCDPDLWPIYEPAFGSCELFMQLMDRVRRVRNGLMHFKGQLDCIEQDAVRKAWSWLGQRPMVGVAPPLVPLEERGAVRATANNPYLQVMGRKSRTLAAGEADE